MIQLFYSDHLEDLVGPLSEQIAVQDPFTPLNLAVPNRNLQMWLNIQLARRLGIAANIRFNRLDPLLVQILAPHNGRELSDNVLQMMILRLLGTYVKRRDPELKGLENYLFSSDRRDSGMRAFQLSRRLVGLFREYSFSRMEMVKAWEQGQAWLADDNQTEAWQRRLWRDLFGPGGMVDRRNQSSDRQPLLPIHQLKADSSHGGQDLHFFGISYVSRFHQQTLKQLAQYRNVFLYVLNPCRIFWEDMRSQQELRHRAIISPQEWESGELETIEENAFLKAWGKPGREYMRLLNDAANWDFRDCFSEPQLAPGQEVFSLLAQLQQGILDRRPPPGQPVLLPEKDDSLIVFGCPSPRREAEVVANTIFQLMLADRELKLQDIAIIVTDMDTYQTEVESALQRNHDLPFNLVDGVTGRASRLIDAVMLLLELPDGQFDRESVFRFYRHPNFRARFSRADVEVWLTITDELSIFHDRKWQAQRSYLDKDLFNWEQGFKRMLLGAYMHSDHEILFRSGQGDYLVYPVTGSDSDQAHLFFTVSESLMNDTDNLHNLELPAAQWAEYLRCLIATYLAPCEGEEADFERLCRAAMGLSELGEGLENELELIPFVQIRAFMLAELRKLSPFYGQYLADGITVSSFMPMRPIPFKTIFVMGLDEGRFPRAARTDTLDLRWARQASQRERIIGDVSERERDRYMFLETLIAARQRLVLSYVDRNDRTGDPSNASSVLTELLYQVRCYKPDFAVARHPLKSYSGEYQFNLKSASAPDLVSFDPVANRLKQVRHNRAELLRRTGGIFPTDALLKIRQNRGELGLDRPDFTRPEGEDNRISISLAQLRQFLECPLQATARRALGMRPEEEDLAEKKDEPFFLNALSQIALLNHSMDRVLQQHQGSFQQLPELDSILEKVIRHAEYQGTMPTGPFLEVMRQHLMGVLEQWRSGLEKLELTGTAQRLRFGRSESNSENSTTLAPLLLELEIHGVQRTVDVVGQTNYLFTDGSGPHLITFVNREWEPKNRFKAGQSKYLLRGFLDSVLMAATGLFEQVNTTIVGTGKTDVTSSMSIAPDGARSYLGTLIGDMLARAHDYLLPVEAVFNAGPQLNSDNFQWNLEQEIQKMIQDDRLSCSSKYGPIRHIQAYHPLADAEPVVQRRFGHLMRTLGLVGEGQ